MTILHGAAFAIHLAVELLRISRQVRDDEPLIGSDVIALDLGDISPRLSPTSCLVVDILEMLDTGNICILVFEPMPGIFQSLDAYSGLAQQYIVGTVTDNVANVMTFAPTQ